MATVPIKKGNLISDENLSAFSEIKSKEWSAIFLDWSNVHHEFEFLDDVPYSESVCDASVQIY